MRFFGWCAISPLSKVVGQEVDHPRQAATERSA
jgi:hypothetical protein